MIKSGVLAAVVLLSMAGVVFSLNLAEWKYQAEVNVADSNEQYCRLAITPEIYNVARTDLGDIRLVSSDGSQVPYILFKATDIKEKKEYAPTVINRSTGKNKAAMVTLDFGKQEIKNSIEIITQGDNFRRAVAIEGSNDNTEFFTLVERGYIFAAGYDKGKRFEQIDLPVNDYRYLRITVKPMAEEEKSPVIEEVKTYKSEERPAERQDVEIKLSEHKEDEKKNSSIYIYDLLYCRLPVSEVELDIADSSFYRYVTLEGRDAATRKVKVESEDNRQRFKEVEVPWEWIGCDTVYRYTAADGKKCEKLVIHFLPGRHIYKYLKIEVSNYDDKPVTIKSASAKMIAHRLLFTSEGSKNLTFYAGSESALAPRYDLSRKIGDPSRIKAGQAKLGSIVDNPNFSQGEKKQIAWTEKHRVLLLGIMVVTVCVLGGFILKSIKSIPKGEPPQN